jgi:preprotein translocase subunit SecF
MDLALVQLVGVIVGTYSSIFFATPLLVSLRERTDLVRTHTRRVLRRRQGAASKSDASDIVTGGAADLDEAADAVPAEAAIGGTPVVGAKPAPGARPARPSSTRAGRPTGKRSTRGR